MNLPLLSFAIGNAALAAHAYRQQDWGALFGNVLLAIGCLVMGAIDGSAA